jgi:hypothetical protein
MPAFNNFLDGLNGGQRAEAVYAYFGWQGGTVHQLAAATGISVGEILFQTIQPTGPIGSDDAAGWSAMTTCTWQHRRDKLAPQGHGNVAYWHGVIAGYWSTRWQLAA